jgi:hypothetical protein
MHITKYNAIIDRFESLIAAKMSHHIALDTVVSENAEFNQSFIRAMFKSAAGWSWRKLV